MQLTYDPKNNIAYIRLRERQPKWRRYTKTRGAAQGRPRFEERGSRWAAQ